MIAIMDAPSPQSDNSKQKEEAYCQDLLACPLDAQSLPTPESITSRHERVYKRHHSYIAVAEQPHLDTTIRTGVKKRRIDNAKEGQYKRSPKNLIATDRPRRSSRFYRCYKSFYSSRTELLPLD